MKLGSWPFGLVIGVFTLLILLIGEIVPHLGPTDAVLPPDILGQDSTCADARAYIQAQFASLPAWVLVWMAFQDIIMASALFFVLWKKEAQIYALGITASHMLVYAWVAAGPIAQRPRYRGRRSPPLSKDITTND